MRFLPFKDKFVSQTSLGDSRIYSVGSYCSTYFLYAAIQSVAMSCCAVLRSSWPAHTSSYSLFLSLSLMWAFQGPM
jgi:hypothetical protein